MLFDDPDLATQWPADLIAAELPTVTSDQPELERLLDEIFVGDDILTRYLAGEWGTPGKRGYGEPVGYRFVIDICVAAESGQLREPKPKAPRWRQRTSGTVTSTMPVKPLRTGFQLLIAEMDTDGFFDSQSNRPCVDDSDEPRKPALDVLIADEFGDYVDLKFLRRSFAFRDQAAQGLLEHDRGGAHKIADLDDDSVYELIEIFHDLAARPRSASYHDFSGCGYHYSQFSRKTGQRLYRWRVNRLLDEQGIDLELAEEGELEGRLIRGTDTARSELVATVAANADGKEANEVEHAIALFRTRNATRENKRSAIVSLARLLENERDLLKAELLTNDESALFQIANKFDLRHNRESEQDDYAEDFLDWIFWWYLATVELIQRIRARQPQQQTG